MVNEHPSDGLQKEREGASTLAGLHSDTGSVWGSAPAPIAGAAPCTSVPPPWTVRVVKHAAELGAFYGAHVRAQHSDSSTDDALCLLHHLSVRLSVLPSIRRSTLLFLPGHFKVSRKHPDYLQNHRQMFQTHFQNYSPTATPGTRPGPLLPQQERCGGAWSLGSNPDSVVNSCVALGKPFCFSRSSYKRASPVCYR